MRNKKIIKIAFAVVVLIIAVAAIRWMKGRSEKKMEEKTEISYTTKEIRDEIKTAKTPAGIEKPTEISWRMTGWGGVEKVMVDQISPPRIDESNLKKLVERLGLEWVSDKEAEDDLMIFGDQKGEKEMCLDTKTNKISFYEIGGKPRGDNIGEEKIRSDFWELIGEMVDINEVRIEGMDYKKLVYPRWISSLRNEAEAIEISANYYVNGLKVISFEGEPIRAIYKLDGQLVKLEIQLPFIAMGEKMEMAVRTFEETKNLPLEDFLVLWVKGGSDYELAASQDKIEKVEINEMELVYIYRNGDRVSVPYFLFVGKSSVNNKIVEVSLALKAIK